MQKLKPQDISAITVKTLKVIPERIIDNYNKRQQPRFRWTNASVLCPLALISRSQIIKVNFPAFPARLDPPGQAISTATQELLRLAEANQNGIATLDPVNDLHLKGVDVVEGVMRQRVLQDSLKDFHCTHSPTFTEQVCLALFFPHLCLCLPVSLILACLPAERLVKDHVRAMAPKFGVLLVLLLLL